MTSPQDQLEKFLADNSEILRDWGGFIASKVGEAASKLLKIDPKIRLKEWASAKNKISTKDYSDPIRQMTDLVGTRFVVLVSEDIQKICSIIEESTFWDWHKSKDTEELAFTKPNLFDYQSIHYELRPRGELSLPSGSATKLHCCEVQVRTLLQHAYAEVEHSSGYKPTGDVPPSARRMFARSIALMETTDHHFCAARSEIARIAVPLDAALAAAATIYRTIDQTNYEINEVDRMVASEFRSEISSPTKSVEDFFRERPNILNFIRDQIPNGGVFQYASCMIAFWLADRIEIDVLNRWPLGDQRRDIETILSQLGIAT